MIVKVSSAIKQALPTVAGLPFRTALIYASLFVAAFGIYGLLWRKAPVLEADSSGYLETARDLSDFHIDQLHDRSPGYPLFLVLTGSSQVPTRGLFFLSLLLHFASIWLLAIVLHAAGLKDGMLNLFGVWLVLPPYVESAAYVMTENLAEFTLVAAFTGLVFWFQRQKTIWLVISSLATSYSALTRPTYQALALVLAGCLLAMPPLFGWLGPRFRDMIKASAIIVSASVFIIGGYCLMNYVKFNYFGLTPLLGFNLSTRTVPFVEQLPDEYGAVREALIRTRDAHLVKRGSSHTGYQYIWAVRKELSELTGLQGAQLSKYLMRLNLTLISKAPLEYVAEVTRSIGRYWLPSTRNMANMGSRPVQFIWIGIHFCLLSLFALQLTMLLGVATHLISRRLVTRRDRAPVIVLGMTTLQIATYMLAGAIVAYTTVISCLVDVGDTRQRVPTDGLILLMLFLGAHAWWRSVSFHETLAEKPLAHGIGIGAHH